MRGIAYLAVGSKAIKKRKRTWSSPIIIFSNRIFIQYTLSFDRCIFRIGKMTIKKRYIFLLLAFLGSSIIAQTTGGRKDYLIDSLKKASIDTIIIVHDDCYGCILSYSEMKTKKMSLKCTTHDNYYIFWMDKAQFYYKAFNNCYEIPVRRLTKFEWLDYFKENQKILISIENLKNIHSIKINSDTIPYSMNCDSLENKNSFTIIDHYGFCEVNISMGHTKYSSGEINDYIFCSNETKNLLPIKFLNSFYSQLKETEVIIKHELDTKGKPWIKSWH